MTPIARTASAADREPKVVGVVNLRDMAKFFREYGLRIVPAGDARAALEFCAAELEKLAGCGIDHDSTLQATNTALQRELAELKATNAGMVERLAKCADAVPTSWLDDILTGPNAVIGEQPWGCPEVERILSAVRKRIAALATSAGERKGEV